MAGRHRWRRGRHGCSRSTTRGRVGRWRASASGRDPATRERRRGGRHGRGDDTHQTGPNRSEYMPTITQHAPGAFCWPELGTSDQNAAKKFYGGLFGWTFNDTPIGPDQVYTIFQLDGRDAAALYTLQPDMLKMGVPPHWETYVAVANADNAAALAKQNGGTILKDAFDVMDAGRMAVIQDPLGATFCVWQANKHA